MAGKRTPCFGNALVPHSRQPLASLAAVALGSRPARALHSSPRYYSHRRLSKSRAYNTNWDPKLDKLARHAFAEPQNGWSICPLGETRILTSANRARAEKSGGLRGAHKPGHDEDRDARCSLFSSNSRNPPSTNCSSGMVAVINSAHSHAQRENGHQLSANAPARTPPALTLQLDRPARKRVHDCRVIVAVCIRIRKQGHQHLPQIRAPLREEDLRVRRLTARRAKDRLLAEHELVHRDPRLATPHRHVQDRPARLDRLDGSHERALVRGSFERQIDAGIGPGQLADFGDDVGLERREEVVSACELCLFAAGRRRLGADDFSERGQSNPDVQ